MKTFLILCATALVSAVSSLANEIIVTPEGTYGYSTIQSALDTVPSNEYTRIIVYPGLYQENLLVTTGQDVLITSTNPPCAVTRAATVVDGAFSGSVLSVLGPMVSGSVVTTCRVEGVTLQNGVATGSGGGIVGARMSHHPYMHVDVIYCVISNCVAQGTASGEGGGGIAFVRGTIISNVITACHATGNGAGGIHYANADVIGNLIYDNHGAQGGGIAMNMFSGAHSPILHNIISNNVSQYDGGGIRGCYGDVAFNVITHNVAQNGGGVFHAAFNHVYNNIVRYNVALGNGGGFGSPLASRGNENAFMNNLVYANVASNFGGGFAYHTMSYHVHNTVAKNTAIRGGGGYYGCEDSIIVNTIIASNFPDNIQQISASFIEYSCVPGAENLSSTCSTNDPLFHSYANNDFRLTGASPCRDAGGEGFNLVYRYVADMDGRLRQHGGAPDMGAYEYDAPPDADGDMLSDADEALYGSDPYAWDTSGDGYADGLLVRRGQSPLMPLTTMTFRVEAGNLIQPIFDAVVQGDTVVLGAGTHRGEFILPRPGMTLHGEMNPNEELLSLIDGEGKRPCLVYLLEPPGPSQITGIESLILSNGFADQGGAILFIRSHATRIRDCLFVHNNAEYGGAISRSNPMYSGLILDIVQSTFRSNSAAREGGALYYMNSTIEDCVFENNTAVNSGGAISMHTSPIRSSAFVGNTSSDGGALYFVQAVVERCLFENNTATRDGGAIAGHMGQVRSSLFIGNAARDGGALHNHRITFSDHLYNNTFVHNTASERGGAVMYQPSTIQGRIINNILWSNAAPEASQIYHNQSFTALFANVIMDGTYDYNANTNEMPLFMDWAAGDYRLASDDTIALNTGTAYHDEVIRLRDLAGNPRLIAPQIDRGCYEHEGAPFDFSLTGRFFAVFNEKAGAFTERVPRHIRRGVIRPPRPASSPRRARGEEPLEVVSLSAIVEQWPNEFAGQYMNAGAVLGDGTMMMSFGANFMPMYIPPDSDIWKWLDELIGMDAYNVHAIAARDTARSGDLNVFLTAGTATSTDAFLRVAVHPEAISTTLPHGGFISAVMGLPDDYGVLFGSLPTGRAFVYGIGMEQGALVTATLSAPPYHLGHGVTPTYDQTFGDIWYVNNEEKSIIGHDLTFGIPRATIPLPAEGDTWVLGSYPDGIVLADKETFTLYNYAITATLPGRSSGYMTPVQGAWHATTVNAPIMGVSTAASQIVIPEPVAACLLYFLGGFLAIALLRRKA